MLSISKRLLFLSGVLSLVFSAALVSADHSWGGYHWARQANPFTLKLGDNLSSSWDSYLATTASDWSQSSVLDAVVVPGGTYPKTCKPTPGRAEICNAKYGRNGWLGIASVWVSGGHITQGTVKMNDTYFNTTTYNKPAWKNLVLCQEVGHVFGLDHQDENFGNTPLGTCMDYSSDPNLNQHPNQHDYEMLESIYAHLDSVNSVSQSAPPASALATLNLNLENHKEWGKEIRKAVNDKISLYERDLGKGHKVFTFVFWAEDGGEKADLHE